MSKGLTIIMYPKQAVGHVNTCVGLAEVLRSRGHKIIFVIDSPFKGKLVKYGFEEEVLTDSNIESESLMPGEQGAMMLKSSGMLSPLSSLDKLNLSLRSDYMKNMINRMQIIEPQLKSLIERHKPDVMIIDQIVTPPAVIYSGKPWVVVWPLTPLIINDERTPPIHSGYPTYNERNGWYKFRQLNQQFFSSVEYNEYLKLNGYPINPNNSTIRFSPFLNIYNYPKELDYTDIRPLPDKWFGVDSFIRKGEEAFIPPVQLKEWKGKLIYFSLGSMGSIDTELMKRLVNILSKSKHKFIVSKGLFGDKYELADNMWGQRSVPQTKVLPLVDLVLTHGGNNTVTETLYFGKPMIVLPLFMDQFDNAQRICEKCLGLRLDPYLCSEEELLNSIDMLLNDRELNEKLILASNRIQNSDTLERVTDKIETLVDNYKYNY